MRVVIVAVRTEQPFLVLSLTVLGTPRMGLGREGKGKRREGGAIIPEHWNLEASLPTSLRY